MNRIIDRFCETVDMVAGFLLGLCTLLVVLSTAGRYLFSWAVPDAFDFSRLLIGACIMWGFAAVGFRGGHIAVDLLWEVVSERWRRIIDYFAWTSLLFFTVLLTVMGFTRLMSAYASNESTFDLRLPVWPMITLIWLGCAASIATTLFAISHLRRNAHSTDLESPIE